MTPLMIAALGMLMVATAFLSGLFGMAGGLILIGVLLALMPLPTAMVLHAITQMASNGWRALLWRAHIRWRPVAVYLIGCALALAVWSLARYVPDKPVALLLLGVTPFMARLTPKGLKPNPDSIWQGTFYGSVCMGLMLMTGVSGPLMDTFFLGARFDRREIVATKAACQVASHFTKLIYFGGIIEQAATLDPVVAAVAVAASMLGTTLARRILEGMSDHQYRVWAGRLITTIASYYILHGSWLLVRAPVMAAFDHGGMQ
ncbi:MAG: sulfite exporter TauE/SafE family protein [Bradyrhizobium sp.]|uniref:sulfite exporter TauE/SafE family protein n=1 Tax=Bradyrhizobium sp. TaxID=376 RepID=UPI0025BF842E|nr:sulfite exporter TauE/SafE family protein [Bradyrhizobium sp.]MBI5262347.1 sulfite exporter TauE/SafE family protein [Bradyrhizobium sp.]